MASGNSDTSTSFIVAPDGSVDAMPTILISDEDARLLREYKKFLQKHGLREALYCTNCWEGQKHDGCEAYVTSSRIMIKCRCRNRYHQGQTF
jgi:hypothetical protein